jgi:hypothetical protein
MRRAPLASASGPPARSACHRPRLRREAPRPESSEHTTLTRPGDRRRILGCEGHACVKADLAPRVPRRRRRRRRGRGSGSAGSGWTRGWHGRERGSASRSRRSSWRGSQLRSGAGRPRAARRSKLPPGKYSFSTPRTSGTSQGTPSLLVAGRTLREPKDVRFVVSWAGGRTILEPKGGRHDDSDDQALRVVGSGCVQ